MGDRGSRRCALDPSAYLYARASSLARSDLKWTSDFGPGSVICARVRLSLLVDSDEAWVVWQGRLDRPIVVGVA